MKGSHGLLFGRTEQHPAGFSSSLGSLFVFDHSHGHSYRCSVTMPQSAASLLITNSSCCTSLLQFLLFVIGSVEGSLAVAMQHPIQDILVLPPWNQDQLSAAFKNLFRSVEESAEQRIPSVLCSCSFSCQDSQRSSPGHYEPSEASSSNGGSIIGTSEQPLHYPSNALLNPGNVNLISAEYEACLDDYIQHCQKTVGPGYKEALHKAFVDNAGTLSSFFYKLPTQWVLSEGTKTFIDTSQFTLESTNKEIIRLKVNTEVLRLMRHQLCEQSQSFREVKIDYFTQFAKLPTKNLLEIALSLSEVNWSANDVCPMLLAYEAIQDVLPFIRKFPSSEPEELFSKIEDNMRKAFRVFFGSMKDSIKHDLESQQNVPIHSVTCSLIHSIKVLFSHRNLVQCFLAPGDEAGSFYNLLDDLIAFWITALVNCPVPSCREWRCIFLLNNFKHFEEADCQDELLSIRELVKQQTELTKDYTEKSWGTAKCCLNSKCRGIRSLVDFTSIFNETFGVQKDWKVPNPVLKEYLRESILSSILLEYERSFKELQGCPAFCFSCFHGASARDIYTPERLESKIRGLFEG